MCKSTLKFRKILWMKAIVHKSPQCSAKFTAEEFQTSTRVDLSREIVRQVLHGMDFHSILISLIPMSSVGWCGVKHTNNGLWKRKNVFFGITKHTFLFSSQMSKPWKRYLPDYTVPTVKTGGGEIMVWGSFSRVFMPIFMPQCTKTFWTMLCLQLCCNSLWKVLLYYKMTVLKCRKKGPQGQDLMYLPVEELNRLTLRDLFCSAPVCLSSAPNVPGQSETSLQFLHA